MDIPEKFHNSLEDQPFSHCKMCDKELLESGANYLIEKAYRRFPDGHGEELLFELAVCFDCATNVRATLSKESLKSVNDFFAAKARERQDALRHLPEDQLLQSCLLTGRDLPEMEEYQIYAHCRGSRISPIGGFYLLSGQVMEEIQNLLSPQTRDELNRFADDNLGTPPELQQLFTRGDIVMI